MDTEEAFTTIKASGLVIRLNCNGAKLDTLQSMISRNGLKEETKKRLIKERDKTKSEFDEKNARIIERFNALYKYSNVYFVPDSIFKEFVAGRRQDVFVDTNNQLFSDSSFPDHFVFGYFDYNMKLNALEFRHSEYKAQIVDYKMIKGAFPKEVKAGGGLMDFFKSIITLGIDWKENLDKTIDKLQLEFKKAD